MLDAAAWVVVNDGVMGGVSRSSVSAQAGHLVFEGVVSLAYNGGFASIRRTLPPDFRPSSARRDSTSPPPTTTLAGESRVSASGTRTERVRLHLTGDGKRYAFVLRDDENPGVPQFQMRFETTGAPQVLELPLHGFEARFRGRPATRALPRIDTLTGIGFLISDQQAGPFRLQVEQIEFLP